MLIIALVLAVIGLAALVTAVVTSNEVIAWVCIGASVIGVLLLIVDALRERKRGAGSGDAEAADDQTAVLAASEPAEDYPDEPTSQFPLAGDDADTTDYPDDATYSDESYPDEAYSDKTEVFETTPAPSEPSEADTTVVAVDDGGSAGDPADEPSDADGSTKRD